MKPHLTHLFVRTLADHVRGHTGMSSDNDTVELTGNCVNGWLARDVLHFGGVWIHRDHFVATTSELSEHRISRYVSLAGNPGHGEAMAA